MELIFRVFAVVVVAGSVGVSAATHSPSTVDAAAGGPVCFGQEATKVSNAGFVPGTSGPDVIVTRSADNSVIAAEGSDRVCLGDGRDFVRGDTETTVCLARMAETSSAGAAWTSTKPAVAMTSSSAAEVQMS